jgi:3',5'-cyclic AMP phosphodiesterase CpdA
MKKITNIVLLIMFSVLLARGQKTAKGFVFEDKNRNGVFDKDEQGIEKVLVSNQKEVVLTDKKGRYSIPVDEESTIFITKPANYDVPLDKCNIPQFYYVYRPEGSPNLQYEGLKPTGKLPDQINFPLYKTTKKDTFKLLVFADVQVANDNDVIYFRKDVISHVLKQKSDVAISLGDLVHDDLSLLPAYNESMSRLGIPYYSVQGNHDVNYDADEKHSSETFRKYYGPNYYSFDYGNVHFICLENIERFCKKGEREKWWDCYRGEVNETQLTWLTNDLKHVPDDKLIVLCQHIPFQRNPDNNERSMIANMNEVFNILEERKNVLVLAGHDHTLNHHYFTEKDNWHGENDLHQIICASVSGSWWSGPKNESGVPVATQIDGVPNGYFILEFNNSSYVHHYYQAGNDVSQLRIEKPASVINQTENEIVVNIFNSNRYTKAKAVIDNTDEINLENKVMYDPYFTVLFNENKDTFISWAHPVESTQIWVGELPSSIAKGIHTLKIEVLNEYDQSITEYAIFEVQ